MKQVLFTPLTENDIAELVQMLLTAGANPTSKHAHVGPALQLASF